MKFGHSYWKVIAMRVDRWLHPRGKDYTATIILQRCKDCGKIREVRFDGDWSDYSDGIYDD